MTRLSQKNRVKNINNKVLLMSELVQKQIKDSMEVLRDHDIDRADKVITGDDEVDNLQQKIEEDCIIFIATEQPLAKDLRNIFTVTKVVTDLERMADYAVDICKLVKDKKVTSKKYLDEAMPLWEMDIMVRGMIDEVVRAFIYKDVDSAIELYKKDKEVNYLYGKIFDDITAVIREKGTTGKTAQLLFVARYLERIGDRVTNICEGIIFVKKGKYIDLNDY
ncbi:phosphate signaling complex protein PhoU [uncultured Clostridium sp.]|uniref:phosphate signaling complex protein PhoU n=1 Tax=uncultured Clostridium sp. TaxID=59620 RepID=UPI0025D7DADC|nr:phosphate signaling complex protein PhoU [uncultured Clostridium sp.]